MPTSPWSPKSHTEPQPLRALIAWDVLRLRGWVRMVSKDRLGFAMVLGLFASVSVAAMVAAFRLGRGLSDDLGGPFLAGAGVALVASLAQAGAGRSLAGGPLESQLNAPRRLRHWTLLRIAVAGAPLLIALIAGTRRLEAGPFAAFGFAVAAMAFAWLPVRAAAGASPAAKALDQPSRLVPRLGLWSIALLPLRTRRLGLPGWAPPVAIALAVGLAGRLAGQHGASELALGIVGGGAILAGSETRALDANLLAMLARTRQPMARLVALFALPPSLIALVAGGLAASLAGDPTAFAAAGLGALGVALWSAVDVLNLTAFGPAGQMRTLIYAALAALLAQAIGPAALVVGLLGLAWLWRLAARRRWAEL